MPGLEDMPIPANGTISKDFGSDTITAGNTENFPFDNLEGATIPDNGTLSDKKGGTYTEFADGADAATPQVGVKGLEQFAIPETGTTNTDFGDGTAGSNP